MSAIRIIDFKQMETTPVVSVMDEERRISGASEQHLSNFYSSSAQGMLSGTWSSEVGKWKIDYSDRHEFCYLTDGHIVLSNEDGEEWTLKKGDAFVIPQGFKGSWEVLEPVTKHYVICKDQTV